MWCLKGRSKIAKFGRNPNGLVMYVTGGVNNRVTEISRRMKGTI
jgi:hypothetical protein